jgi:hypothetical protein
MLLLPTLLLSALQERSGGPAAHSPVVPLGDKLAVNMILLQNCERALSACFGRYCLCQP